MSKFDPRQGTYPNSQLPEGLVPTIPRSQVILGRISTSLFMVGAFAAFAGVFIFGFPL